LSRARQPKKGDLKVAFFSAVKCVSTLNADGFARGLKLWFFPVDINVFSIYECAWWGMIATQAGTDS